VQYCIFLGVFGVIFVARYVVCFIENIRAVAWPAVVGGWVGLGWIMTIQILIGWVELSGTNDG